MKFGIIGSNFIVDEFLENALKIEGFEFYSMYSRSIEKANKFQDKYGCKFCFDDMGKFLDSGIACLYVASPILIHEEQVIKALNKKINVLCEKIMTVGYDSFLRMKEAAIRNDVLLMDAMVPVYTKSFQVIRDNLYRLGDIRRAVFSYNQYSSRYDNLKNGIVENAFKPELGSGAVTDIGVYVVECAINLFGNPNSVIGNNLRLYTGAIGQGSVIFTYDDMDCILMYSKIVDSFNPCQIIGEEGILEFSNINRLSKVTFIGRDKNEKILIDDNKNAMSYEIEHFIHLVRNNLKSSYINPLDFTGLSIKIIDEINKF